MNYLYKCVVFLLSFAVFVLSLAVVVAAIRLSVDHPEQAYLSLLRESLAEGWESGPLFEVYRIVFGLWILVIALGAIVDKAGAWIREWLSWGVDPRLQQQLDRYRRESSGRSSSTK